MGSERGSEAGIALVLAGVGVRLGDVPEQTGEGAQIGESRELRWDPVCWDPER